LIGARGRPRLPDARSLAEYFGRFGVQLSSTMLPVRALKKAKMTELERYLVRMGSKGWMVWDRQARAPARLGRDGRPAIDLTDEQAREIKDELTKKSHSER
jgi:hypothetical protein